MWTIKQFDVSSVPAVYSIKKSVGHQECCEPCFLIVNGQHSTFPNKEGYKSIRAMGAEMIKNVICQETHLSLVKARSFRYEVKMQSI